MSILLKLNRFSIKEPDPLKAFNAADEYILQYTKDLDIKKFKKVLIVNDTFGALTLTLAEKTSIVCYGDSISSFNVIKKNAATNHIDLKNVHFVSSQAIVNLEIDLIIMKIPDSLELLRYQLQSICSQSRRQTKIIAAEMTKYINRPLLNIFEEYCSDVKTTLAIKKARLIEATIDVDKEFRKNIFETSFQIDDLEIDFKAIQVPASMKLHNNAGTFSKGKLDQGSRLLLENLIVTEKEKVIYDLGCGNGVFGIIAGLMQPTAEIHFFDTSYLAIESAKKNCLLIGLQNEVFFHLTDCMTDEMSMPIADLILCNPPYHTGHTKTNETALRMFSESLPNLKSGGSLLVVANHHLNYSIHIEKLFSNVKEISRNKKYHLLLAHKE